MFGLPKSTLKIESNNAIGSTKINLDKKAKAVTSRMNLKVE